MPLFPRVESGQGNTDMPPPSAWRGEDYSSRKPSRRAAEVTQREPPRPWPARRSPVMAPATWPFLRFLAKGGLAGGALYVVYSQGLLSDGDQGAQALRKAQDAIPPAVEEWTKYFGWQLPAVPKTEFSIRNSWNSGVRTVISALSVAPTRACDYTHQGWKYMKDLIK